MKQDCLKDLSVFILIASIGLKYNTTYYYFEKNLQGDIVGIYNEAGVGVGIGAEVDTESCISFEMITRMDFIGFQLKDGKFRVGHPGRVAVTAGVPGFSIGPYNDVFEDFDGNLDPKDDSKFEYYDRSFSRGGAAYFMVGYHYGYSLSWVGVLEDMGEYLARS